MGPNVNEELLEREHYEERQELLLDVLLQHVDRLSPLQRDIVHFLYFRKYPLTDAEAQYYLSMSSEAVLQIHAQALHALRQSLSPLL